MRLSAKYLGHSVNDIPPEMVTRIEQMLIRQKPYVKAFHDDNGQDMLLAGDVDLVLEYNGDIAQAMKENPDLDFVIPKEGSAAELRHPVHPARARRVRTTPTSSSTTCWTPRPGPRSPRRSST